MSLPLDTIHCGDCIEFMKALPDGCVDAVVTDPPYGINLDTNYKARGRGRLADCSDYPPIHGDDRPFDPSPWLNYPITALCGANYYADRLPPSPRWLVWDKRDGMASNNQADCELIWTNAKGPARVFRHRWNGMIKASERTARRCHPTQKPIALMAWVLDQVRVPSGGVVFDPFMGSGTTAVACIATGRHYIGCEISEDYCAIAERRIREANGGPLFADSAERQGAFA